MLRAPGHGQIASTGERNEFQSVFEALLRGDIAGDNRYGAHIELGGIQRQEQGHRIVGAWISVDDDLARHRCLDRQGRQEGEQEQ